MKNIAVEKIGAECLDILSISNYYCIWLSVIPSIPSNQREFQKVSNSFCFDTYQLKCVKNDLFGEICSYLMAIIVQNADSDINKSPD